MSDTELLAPEPETATNLDRLFRANVGRKTFDLSPVGLPNAGIVRESGHPRRSYQMAGRREGDRYIPPDTWQLVTPRQEGSWWPAWQGWLAVHSGGPERPPPIGAPETGYPPLTDALGCYVLQP